MIRCAVGRGSKTASRLSPFTRTISTVLVEDGAQHLHHATPSQEGNQATKKLPISPLMDPEYLKARQRHHLPKKIPKKADLTPFQEKLRKNPYALALATDVRQCKVTRQRLPHFFLQGYTLLAHPETDMPWWMPADLAVKESKSVKRAAADTVGNGVADSRGEALGENMSDAQGAQIQEQLAEHITEDLNRQEAFDSETSGASEIVNTKEDSRVLGPSVYTILRKELLTEMRRNPNMTKAFVDVKNMKNPRGRELYSSARFRQDSDEFLLELMRRRSVEALTRLLDAKRGYVIGCKDWDDALMKKGIGAYLRIGGDLVPKQFLTLNMGVGRENLVPVHNLQVLLGEEHLKALKERFTNNIFDNEVLVLKHRRRTVGLQMRLWQLQGYLAEVGNLQETN